MLNTPCRARNSRFFIDVPPCWQPTVIRPAACPPVRDGERLSAEVIAEVPITAAPAELAARDLTNFLRSTGVGVYVFRCSWLATQKSWSRFSKSYYIQHPQSAIPTPTA